MTETREIRLKRLKIRSWRRGTKEMDLLLGGFADAKMANLSDAELDAYERLMDENDQDLYAWLSGQTDGGTEHAEVMALIRTYHKIG